MACTCLPLLTCLPCGNKPLSGVTYLGPFGVAAMFSGLLSGVIGISIFSLGLSFNYLVSLFYKHPVRQGLFGRSIVSSSLEHHFWWIGGLSLLVGFGVAVTCFALGIRGWEITRIWFYLLASAAMMLVGVQLVISWVSLRVLEELNKRDILTERDLNGTT